MRFAAENFFERFARVAKANVNKAHLVTLGSSRHCLADLAQKEDLTAGHGPPRVVGRHGGALKGVDSRLAPRCLEAQRS